jgi:hypothetical protein
MENRIIICQDSAQLNGGVFLFLCIFLKRGIKDITKKAAYELDLKKPIQGDLAELVALATKELKKQNVTL